MSTRVTVPKTDDSVTEVTVTRWLKNVGDPVNLHDPLVEVETNKVTLEVPAEVAGTLLEIVAVEGQTVPAGATLAYIDESDEPEPSGQAEAAPPRPVAEAATQPRLYLGPVTPVVRRMAAEHNIDLNLVQGTGANERITKKDLLAYLESRPPAPEPAHAAPAPPAPPAPAVDSPPPVAEPQADEVIPLTRMRQRIAEHMVHSKHTSPHVTTVFEVDFSAVAAHLVANKPGFARDGVRLTYTAYIVNAVVRALKKHPPVNSNWSDKGIVLKRRINIGLATATEDGLIVPVIKQADQLNLLGLAQTIDDLAQRARRNQLQAGDVQGGTFTLTNHGMAGSLFATPIINQPQCGILGVGLIEKRAKVINDAIAIRPCAFVGFTFDHRILDGAEADAFVRSIKEILEAWS